MQDCDYMEVEEDEMVNGLPNLQCLKLLPIKEEAGWLLQQQPIHSPSSTQSVSFTANAPAIWLVKEPTVMPDNRHGVVKLTQDYAAVSQVQQQRHQQTNQPMCPPNEDSLPAPSFYPDGDHCPPSIAGFDNFPSLSLDEITRILSPQLQTQDVPSVPEISDASSPSQLHLMIGLLPQPPLIPEHSRPRQRSNTVTLVSDREDPSTPSSACCNAEAENVEILNELMDEGVFDDEPPVPNCAELHIPIPPACKATSHEQRMYMQTADYILAVHLIKSRDVPHAKKKPMLHEFLGYILFGGDDEKLACLKGSVYFCRETGDRVTPVCAEKKFFRVVNFPAVSEVWRLIKCNSSADCIKNMKRAMRMSTTNDRKFFVNLSHRMHRMQIFQFGDRSLDFFKKAFPEYFSQCPR